MLKGLNTISKTIISSCDRITGKFKVIWNFRVPGTKRYLIVLLKKKFYILFYRLLLKLIFMSWSHDHYLFSLTASVQMHWCRTPNFFQVSFNLFMYGSTGQNETPVKKVCQKMLSNFFIEVQCSACFYYWKKQKDSLTEKRNLRKMQKSNDTFWKKLKTEQEKRGRGKRKEWGGWRCRDRAFNCLEWAWQLRGELREENLQQYWSVQLFHFSHHQLPSCVPLHPICSRNLDWSVFVSVCAWICVYVEVIWNSVCPSLCAYISFVFIYLLMCPSVTCQCRGTWGTARNSAVSSVDTCVLDLFLVCWSLCWSVYLHKSVLSECV